MTTPVQRPHRSRQDYATPPAFLDAVKVRLGIDSFSFDFAADKFNTKARDYFDEVGDALSVPDWETYTRGGCGWLNPPFERIDPWASKCRQTKERGGSIAFLVPASVGANWFRDHVHGHALVLALNGRLAFIPERPTWLYPKDCILALYSPAIRPGFKVWTWKREL